ncbi:hypothetical protein LCGC14_1313180 [marine sediment metagenome]|uniref:Rubredoxin-like domain-containing protein n=1 Tax=marine sediment metagenome TaxID=412755 RepID=A0A0F9N2P9_9ZZZZ
MTAKTESRWRHCPQCNRDLWVPFSGTNIQFTEPTDFPCPICTNPTSTLVSTRPPGTIGL